MSRILTSPDIEHLIRDGFSVRVTAQYLVIADIPYLGNDKTVKRNGMIAGILSRNNDGFAARPQDHTVNFFGDGLPCDSAGQLLDIKCSNGTFMIDNKKALACCSRHKKGGDYADFYEKMTSYISYISAPAVKIDSSATPRLYRSPIDETEDSVFAYGDSATARNGTGDLSTRLMRQKVAIIGLGGTGGYILDLIAKTPVSEIRLFDGDKFYSHNAFRAPGAASLPCFGCPKVEYFASVYSKMHKGITPNAVNLEVDNLSLLDGIDFVFMCLDEPQAKTPIIGYLQKCCIPFIDTGMDVVRRGDALCGTIRTTFCSADETGRRTAQKFIDMVGEAHENEYDADIQIAELNALNAVLAVIRWKRQCGYYCASYQGHCVSYANMIYSLSLDNLEHEKLVKEE